MPEGGDDGSLYHGNDLPDVEREFPAVEWAGIRGCGGGEGGGGEGLLGSKQVGGAWRFGSSKREVDWWRRKGKIEG